MRIYCDTNIFRLIKPSHSLYNSKLHADLESLKNSCVFVFSHTHIQEIIKSDINYHKEDLDILENFSEDNYWLHDSLKDHLKPYIATPNQVYEDYSKPDKLTKYSGPYESIVNKLIEATTTLSKLTNAIVHESIKNSSDDIKNTLSSTVNMLYPTDINSTTDFFKYYTNLENPIFNDKKFLTQIRKLVQKYIDKNNFSYEKWKMLFNTKLKETFGKTFEEYLNESIIEQNKNSYYHRVQMTFVMLELFGVTTEKKSKKGLKEFSTNNIIADAQHCYYAAHSDVLISEDIGFRLKSEIVYKMYGIKTKVMSALDFKTHTSYIRINELNNNKLTSEVVYDLKKGLAFESFEDKNNATFSEKYYTSTEYLNYFNRIQIITTTKKTIVSLYRDRLPLGNFILFSEIKKLISKLLKILGMDSENKGEYTFSESRKFEIDDIIRHWEINGMKLHLSTANVPSGAYICFIFEISK